LSAIGGDEVKVKARYTYIHFEVIAIKPKTKVWGCFNNSSGAKLGEVK